MHDIPQRKSLLKLPGAHKGKVSGLCWSDGDRLLSCGVDRTVKLWDTRTMSDANGDMDVEAGPSQVRIEYVTNLFWTDNNPEGTETYKHLPRKIRIQVCHQTLHVVFPNSHKLQFNRSPQNRSSLRYRIQHRPNLG